MRKLSLKHFQYAPFYLLYIVLFFASINKPFFWDTIQLASRHAHFYYETGLSFQHLPDSIDSGHPFFFGYYLALWWSVFDKTILISHLSILPFLIGIVYQSTRLTEKYFTGNNRYLALTVFLIEPTLLAQTILVSPDICLVYFMLLLINAIISKNSLMKCLAVMGLALISMRGWMVGLVLFLFDYYKSTRELGYYKAFFNRILPYMPGGLIAVSFLVWHYVAKGWIGYHEDSPWQACFEPVDFKGFIYNIGIYCWRLLDFGRISIWLLVLIIPFLLRKIKNKKKSGELVLLSALFLILLPISMLFHKNLLGHRYLLPIFLIVSLTVCYYFFELITNKRTKLISFSFLLITLLAGHLIIYPDKISQGWDSSLAHLPYYSLRDEALLIMKEKKIDPAITGTAFPFASSPKYIDLGNDTTSFGSKNLTINQYFLYSNIINDVTDDEYEILHRNWILIHQSEKRGIRVSIFKNPDNGH